MAEKTLIKACNKIHALKAELEYYKQLHILLSTIATSEGGSTLARTRTQTVPPHQSTGFMQVCATNPNIIFFIATAASALTIVIVLKALSM